MRAVRKPWRSPWIYLLYPTRPPLGSPLSHCLRFRPPFVSLPPPTTTLGASSRSRISLPNRPSPALPPGLRDLLNLLCHMALSDRAEVRNKIHYTSRLSLSRWGDIRRCMYDGSAALSAPTTTSKDAYTTETENPETLHIFAPCISKSKTMYGKR
jgi:hypothetical protein